MAVNVTFSPTTYSDTGETFIIPFLTSKKVVGMASSDIKISATSPAVGSVENAVYDVIGFSTDWKIRYTPTPRAYGKMKLTDGAKVIVESSSGGNTVYTEEELHFVDSDNNRQMNVEYAFDTRQNVPEVEISVVNTTDIQPIQLAFRFTQEVFDFSTDSINVIGGTVANVHGDGTYWTAEWTITGSGSTDIEVNENSVSYINAAGEEDKCPKENTFINVSYDLTVPAEGTAGTTLIVEKEYGYYGSVYGGMGDVLECVQLGSWLYVLAERIPYGRFYDRLAGSGMRTDLQAGAVFFKWNISTNSVIHIKTYPIISTAPRSLIRHNNKVYYFEGSHYSAWNEGYKTERADVDAGITHSFHLERTSTLESTTGTLYFSTTGGVSYAAVTLNGDALENFSDIFRWFTQDDTDTTSEYAKYTLFGAGLLKVGDVEVSEPGGLTRFTFSYELADGVLPEVHPSGFIVRLYHNIVDRYQINRLKGVPEAWKTEPGHLYSIDNSTTVPTDHGYVLINQDIPSPYRNAEQSFSVEDPLIDRYYGVHIGMSSQMISDGNDLHLYTGYGDLDNISDLENPIIHDRNWIWSVYSPTVEQRVPKLMTNGKTIADVLIDFTSISDSFFYFDDEGEFVWRPRRIRSATTDISLPNNSTTIVSLGYSNYTRDALAASDGYFLIGKELFKYASTTGTAIQSVERGQLGTNTATHVVNSEMQFVDHIFDLNAIPDGDNLLGMEFTTEYDALFNRIVLTYGNGLEVIREDDTSIAAYGTKVFSKTLDLDDSQTQWVEKIAESLLKSFSTLRYSTTLTIRSTFSLPPGGRLELGNVVYFAEDERSDLQGCFQITGIAQNLTQQTTRLTIVSV